MLRPTGVFFVDESLGWVIGEGHCPHGVCVLHTRDGGWRWHRTSAPSTALRDVRFADERNGWAFDRDLWSTHDGGATWKAVELGSPVFALETTGDRVYALATSCGLRHSECQGAVRLYEAEVGADTWRPVLTVDVGSDRPNGQVVVSGRSAYVIVHPQDGPTWPGERPVLYAITPTGQVQRRSVPSPCGVRAYLAVAGPGDLSLWCQTGDGAGGSAPHVLYRSRNGGKTWARRWDRRSVYYGPAAITPQGTFLGISTAELQIDRPDGTSEIQRFNASGAFSEQVHAVSFVTAWQGAVLTGPAEGWLYITRDAGRTWEPVNFG